MLARPFRRPGRRLRALTIAALLVLVVAPVARANPIGQIDNEESSAREMFDALIQNGGRAVHPTPGKVGVLNAGGASSQANRQVNDPLLDEIQSFLGAPPFQFAIESETSLVSVGNDLVTGYNSSAGAKVADAQGDFSQILFSGYSVSHDNGQTWQSGFVPPAVGGAFTVGDPALATDRAGNIYYAGLSADANFNFGIQVNKSTDHGDTWAPGSLVVSDNGADKEWIAVGPDPTHPSRDNVYVTWTHYRDDGSGSELWLARSIDGGATWTTKQLYAPQATAQMSSFIQFSNPTVDASTGRLYVPFLHAGNFDSDYIKVLVSDDGGQTFSFLNFNVPGAPETTGFPNVSPGSLEDCGQFGGPRLALHEGPSTPGPLFGLPRWVQSTRLITQPSAAAANGRLFIALNTSTNPVFGAGTGSKIRVLYSPDGGTTWAAPVTVAASTTPDPQHVHPALTVDQSGTHVHVIYYVQSITGRLRVDGASGTVTGDHVVFGSPSRVSAGSFDLIPSNITVDPNTTLNFDSIVAPCYDIGEYASVAMTSSGAVASWGDNRKLWKEPAGGLVTGVHNQPDVFFDRAP